MRPEGVALSFTQQELWRPIYVTEKTGKRRIGKSVVARLFERVVEAADGCWLWTGLIDQGYGRMKVQRHQVPAHRVAYMALVGDIPEGLELDHLCRVRNCVNPEHLEPVPPRINNLRGETITAANALKTHCQHGHELNTQNLHPRRDGRRECHPCRLEAGRQYRAKKRAA